MEKGVLADHNLFIKGGQFDGNGLAGCANVMGLKHFTMADTTYRNGKRVGLQLGDPSLPRSTEGGYEIICNNLYFVCNLSGLAGNVGFLTYIGDSHFTDIVVVDYTIGIRDCKWSNRYTRCHVWGGPVKKAGTNIPEMLENSIPRTEEVRTGDNRRQERRKISGLTSFSQALTIRSWRDFASPPSLPLTPCVSDFVQGGFVPSAITASVRGTRLTVCG